MTRGLRVTDPADRGKAILAVEHAGLTHMQLAHRIADNTGRRPRTAYNQLWCWQKGAEAPNAQSLRVVLDALGVDLALIPREDT